MNGPFIHRPLPAIHYQYPHQNQDSASQPVMGPLEQEITLPPINNSFYNSPHGWPQAGIGSAQRPLTPLMPPVCTSTMPTTSAYHSLQSQFFLPMLPHHMPQYQPGPPLSLSQSIFGPVPGPSNYGLERLTPPLLPTRPVELSSSPRPGPSPFAQAEEPQLISDPQQMPVDEQRPMHVVGQQGRRGILPADPGFAAPSSGETREVFTKNKDDRYPCMHCHATYRRVKHLKRHIMRHQGLRPYECWLCRVRFSRTDVLKRHFQKCSDRKGNPTGEDHLAYTGARNRRRKSSNSVTGGHAHSTSNVSQASSAYVDQALVPSLPPDQSVFTHQNMPLSPRSLSVGSSSLTRQNSQGFEQESSVSEFASELEQMRTRSVSVQSDRLFARAQTAPVAVADPMDPYAVNPPRLSYDSASMYGFGTTSSGMDFGSVPAVGEPVLNAQYGFGAQLPSQFNFHGT